MSINSMDNPGFSGLEVLVIGESLVDVVSTPLGTTEFAGGSPANVAYGLGRLGVRTGLLTSIGQDRHGRMISRHLENSAVELLDGSGREARTATSIANIQEDGSAHYAFDISWALESKVSVPEAQVMHTGSIAAFLEPGATRVREIIGSRPEGCLVTFDPNIRPALLGEASKAKEVFEAMAAMADVVKLSDEDAGWLYPELLDAGVVSHVLELGAELVVITNGGEGSVLATAAVTVNVPAVKTAVADTIGAGDSYMSALIYGLLRHGRQDLNETALRQLGETASRAAAITVGRPGPNPPTARELGTGALSAAPRAAAAR